jgi:hypothetical protein
MANNSFFTQKIILAPEPFGSLARSRRYDARAHELEKQVRIHQVEGNVNRSHCSSDDYQSDRHNVIPVFDSDVSYQPPEQSE